MVSKIAALIVMVGMGALAAGCNTVAGVGADIKAAGSGIEKAAEKTKPY
jgi:predicted small secreted protein